MQGRKMYVAAISHIIIQEQLFVTGLLKPCISKLENFEDSSEKNVFKNYGRGDNFLLSENSLVIPVENLF